MRRGKPRFRLSRSVQAALNRMVDSTLSALLFLGAWAHAYGAFKTYPVPSEVLVWSLSGSLTVMLLAVLNGLRISRPDDAALAWICCAGCVGWAAVALAHGAVIGHLFDPRVVYQVVVALALADRSVMTATRRAAWAPRTARVVPIDVAGPGEDPVPAKAPAPVPVRVPASVPVSRVLYRPRHRAPDARTLSGGR